LGGDFVGHCEKNVHMNMCLIVTGYRDRTVWIPRPNSVRFLFLGLNGEKSLQGKVDTRDVLLDRILDAAARIKKREDQLKQHAVFAHEFLSARLKMGFANVYCEL
jgi:hypothetical protein